MNFLNRAIDKFCYKHPRFGIRNLMLYIIIGNAIVFLFEKMDTTGLFVNYLYFNSSLILSGQVWRLFTFIFIPDSSSILSAAITLYFYYFIGSSLEREWGSGRFTIYYFSGVILTIIFGFVVNLFYPGQYLYIDAYYLNLSMFFAFATLFPDMRLLLFFFIPIKIKWLAIADGVLFLLGVISNPFPLNLLPVVAVLNFLVFCGGALFGSAKAYKRVYNKQSTNFRQSVRQAKYENENKNYNHKCAVCGRTDTDYPDLEFRYCSKCQGYHCFCQDHINSHIHFQ